MWNFNINSLTSNSKKNCYQALKENLKRKMCKKKINFQIIFLFLFFYENVFLGENKKQNQKQTIENKLPQNKLPQITKFNKKINK